MVVRNFSRPLLVGMLSLVTGVASASFINETETSGQMTNNDRTAAQAIAAGAFSLPVPDTVFGSFPTATVHGTGGGEDVDFYHFSSNGGTAFFDIDNDPYTFDTILTLFDASGTEIAEGDDSDPVDPGGDASAEDGDYDAFLGAIDLLAGEYFIAVSQYDNFATGGGSDCQSSQDLFRPDYDDGNGDDRTGGYTTSECTVGDSSFYENGPDQGLAYTLHISLEDPSLAVPEPSNLLLLGIALAGLGLFSRRRLRG